MPRKLFVTTALPYANAQLHIGHIMEYIQADIWVRFQRMQKDDGTLREVHFVCADDVHGAPIMIAAEKAGKTPQDFVREIAATRPKALNGFHISFDHWDSTGSPENHELTRDIYLSLKERGMIESRVIEQFYDPVKEQFLPDRFIKGICPRCRAKDQNGDSCEVCSSFYTPPDLIEPYSVLTGVTPVLKPSEHFFFRLSDPQCVEFLREWIQGQTDDQPRLQPEVANKAKEWLGGKEGQESTLVDWDISRDAPYFGIEIPDAPGKYFYVWLDAPIGYLASLKNHFEKTGRDFDAFMADPATEQYHFIGKDIIYFHTLFFPAMLHFSGRKVPDNVFAHGFITVSGEKMSKSRGTGISPDRYLDVGMNPEWLRYYIAAKLNAHVEDVDFTAEDFIARVNSDLIGKYVNIAARAAGFITKQFGGAIAADTGLSGQGILDQMRQSASEIAHLYESREFSRAIRQVMHYADQINAYVDQNKPWVLVKDPAQEKLLHEVCSNLLEAFRMLTIYLKPVLPSLATSVERFLNVDPMLWEDIQTPLPAGHVINSYKHLMQRVDEGMIDRLFDSPEETDESKEKDSGEQASSSGMDPIAAQITIEDFARIDLRIAKIVHCRLVEGADNLLELSVDVGEGRLRTVFAGIRKAYKPEDLEGKLTAFVANLAPRKMKFGVSEGMILAASDPADSGIYILQPWPGAEPGMRIR